MDYQPLKITPEDLVILLTAPGFSKTTQLAFAPSGEYQIMARSVLAPHSRTRYLYTEGNMMTAALEALDITCLKTSPHEYYHPALGRFASQCAAVRASIRAFGLPPAMRRAADAIIQTCQPGVINTDPLLGSWQQ